MILAISVLPVSAYSGDPIYHATSFDEALASMEENPTAIKVSFTEAEFIASLEEQGFSVETVSHQDAYQNRAARSRFIIRKPLTTDAAPVGGGKVGGNHFINAVYDTFYGWNYFVSYGSYGIALSSSGYTCTQWNNYVTFTHGNQGIEYSTTVVYEYTTSRSISLSGGWFFGVSVGSNYTYRTNSVNETSTYVFPLVG